MTVQCKKIDTLKVPLQTKPGQLFKCYAAFKEAGVNIISSWAYEMGPDRAEVIFYASDNAKAKEALEKAGMTVQTSQACYATGEDQIGYYTELLQKISDKGVNLVATDAFGINGRLATAFFCKDEDLPRLCEALGC